jgi:hypothetical protein
MKNPMKRFKPPMKRLMKPCKSLILNNETLGNAETLHRACGRTCECTHAKAKKIISYIHATSVSCVSMRFIPMKINILKRFIKRFISDSSVSLAGVAA